MLKRLMLTALFCAAASAAGAAERTILVLDASGSMWGRIDGRPKLELAREALREVLATVPADVEIGLMAYGHRRKGQCDDIELVVPPAPGAAAAIGEAVETMRFLGKTPLTEAVRQAAEALRYTEDKATVVLVTDGIETCNADPCALGAELEKSGVDFTAHVVGFGLTREEGRQVACLAENTGGRYIQAGDAGQLGEALKKTVAAPVEKPVAVTLPPATVSTGTKPVIGQGFAVQWSGPGGANDYVDIVAADAEKELAYAYVKQGEDAQLRAPGKAGTYQIRYVWDGPDKDHVLATATVEVMEAENAIVAPASVAIGQTFEVEWKGPGQQGDYLDIVPEGHEEASGELSYVYVEQGGNVVTLKAPGSPGPHKLRYVLEAPDGRRVLVSVPLAVTEAVASLAFPPTVMAGTDIDVAWKGPAGAGDYVDLVPEGHKDAAGEIAYFYLDQSSDGETGTLRAPGDPGRYVIRYVLQASDSRKVLASEPLDVTPVQAALNAPRTVAAGAEFAVEWSGPGSSGDYVDLVPAGHAETAGELAYAYVSDAPGERTAKLRAPDEAGAYQVRYILEASGGRRVAASVPLTVE
ncbi:VWA domain-containing protein [Mesorhizobium sp. ZMM04-5]|uniref:VWA domain-containing protein n=1 Tax=Mesorhizobium marinum TaxID=3228790 RepID=A0ABV3R3G2_9HYPH